MKHYMIYRKSTSLQYSKLLQKFKHIYKNKLRDFRNCYIRVRNNRNNLNNVMTKSKIEKLTKI